MSLVGLGSKYPVHLQYHYCLLPSDFIHPEVKFGLYQLLKANLAEIGNMLLLAWGQYVLLTPTNVINGKGANLQYSLVVNIDPWKLRHVVLEFYSLRSEIFGCVTLIVSINMIKFYNNVPKDF